MLTGRLLGTTGTLILHKQSRKRRCGVYLLPGHFIAQRLLNPKICRVRLWVKKHRYEEYEKDPQF